MLEFIALLRQRYQSLLEQLDDSAAQSAIFRQRLEQLVFAEAFIRKGEILQGETRLPLQIAVIGPTQAGKSSVCNALLGAPLAGVSALAGFTVHPQGFCAGVTMESASPLQHYFGRYQRLEAAELSQERYDCFALSENPHDAPLLPPCILWDTPDFDSIDSPDYKEGVMRTIALADIVILVLSKEKYADQSVWEMMAMIEVFKQPTLICINKLPENTEEVIIRSLKQKWQQARGDVFPDVMPLFYQKLSQNPSWQREHERLIYQLAKRAVKRKHFRYQQELIHKYWANWLEPVLAEHRIAGRWRELVDEQAKYALKAYQRDYLDHPHYYETFQKALIELLNLLEIPGIAKVLTKTRRVLTWPVRTLLSFKQHRAPEGYSSQELSLLNQQAEHFLIRLSEQLLEKSDGNDTQTACWREIYRLLRQRREFILEEFDRFAADYQQNFGQDIEASARALYEQLQQQPLLLNSLRTTRISADAAAIALVIQTGGIGVHDFVITPAMLSITSLLTESALGGYLNRTETKLKQRQLETVRQQLFQNCLQDWLYRLPEQMTGEHYFNISPEQLAVAEKQRTEIQNGLRLL